MGKSNTFANILKPADLTGLYTRSDHGLRIAELLSGPPAVNLQLKGLIGSSRALVVSSVFDTLKRHHLIILPDKETAAYFYNDLEALFGEKDQNLKKKSILFFPTSYKRSYAPEQQDSTNLLMRAEVLNRIGASRKKTIIVTYSEALAEKVVTRKHISRNTLKFKTGEAVSLDFLTDTLFDFGFERVDFVYEPGQISVRGGIVDVFSFSNELPFRIELIGDTIGSIRIFDPSDQLSLSALNHVTILPNVQDRMISGSGVSFLADFPKDSLIWFDNVSFTSDMIRKELEKAIKIFEEADTAMEQDAPASIFIDATEFLESLNSFSIIEFGRQYYFQDADVLLYDQAPQPSFNKSFDILISNLEENSAEGIQNFIFSDNPKQIERIYSIFDDIQQGKGRSDKFHFTTLNIALHEGFIDRDMKIACYTDHQIFERYHKFHLKESFSRREAITIKELYSLNPGDYVTHIDYGIGRFDGLEKIDNNGRWQEAIRIVYKNNDLLYVSIHSLHRISKYVGKEGSAPKLNKLGSNAWNRLKSKTKKKVQDIARNLIKLYAERKDSDGLQFSPDTYLQNELEASFIYEDTPDQLKATVDVKKDMEQPFPMDRLICGDVGFGKTEIAIRAAFKAVADSKQVAILVPTTILALQHYKTFSDRLGDFPCNIDYINRFKSAKDQKASLARLEEGSLDIIIGTHRLLSKDIKFKDLGLLIVDEEQKFGVASKEKLKQLKVNVDILILTATPIPRTLQFSLMGARDLSIINTAPSNRYPIQTEVHSFGEEVIRDAIRYEVSREGQVFFVHNRVQNIMEVEHMISRFCPEVSIGVVHGQMAGARLEKVMLDFINGQYDVLLATTIIESGLDIPNANTIIINEAQNYGLSDLHQLRGRVGRSNRKAFCYLLSPPMSVLTTEARKRLKAIEEFSDLGSGFNIAMRDLDIRGAGNMLGAEQSGFISDIGFEMYHKILDEAIQELKDGEFKEVFGQGEARDYVKDCQIDSDLEILIPDDYVTNITERLNLYKELDNIEAEEELHKFRLKLTDRFGPVAPQTEELIDTIRLRWMAKKIGFEKILMKNGRFTGYFISNQESSYFQSEKFTRVLLYVQQHPSSCRLREANEKLTLIIFNIRTVNEALIRLGEILG